MDDHEIADAIASAKSLQLATVDEDGAPHLSTVWFGMLDGDIAGWTPRDSRKGRNLQRDQRVAVLVESGEAYTEIRGVSIRGRVDLVTEPRELARVATAIFERNFPADQRPDVDSLVEGGRRIGFIVRPNEVASWDHRKLDGAQPKP